MKKIVLLFIFSFFFLLNTNLILAKNNTKTNNNVTKKNISNTNYVEKITLQKFDNFYRIIVYSKIQPKYNVNIKNNIVNIDFMNLSITKAVINKFIEQSKIEDIEIKKTPIKHLKFFIDKPKIIKNIYINPDKSIKFYRIIIDIEDSKIQQKKEIKKNKPESKKAKIEEKVDDENYSFSNLEDLIENKVAFAENSQEKLDNFLNELLEFKILEKEFSSNKPDNNSELDQFIANDFEIEKQIEQGVDKIDVLDLITRNTFKPNNKKEFYIVVIDAGHGGKDPGTIGVKKSKEKNINLIYAQTLKRELEKNKKIRVYMTRNDDEFFELSERIKIARNYTPDLFISLHSNYSSNKETRGLSVYTLSKTASDKRTAELATTENRNNLLAGVDLFNEYQDTINTLVDLSRVEVLNDSKNFANLLINDFTINELKVIDNPHRSASFGVLLAPDFPSVLVELGFLSNKKEEGLLQTYKHRRNIIQSLRNSIEKYFHL